jgi:hypothetical protein
MGIPLGSSFTVNTALPLDDRCQVVSIVARDAISALRRYQGMQVYVIADTKTYVLKTGVTNADWVELAGSGGGSLTSGSEKFSGDSILTSFTLTGNPSSLNNTQVYIGGVYQQKTLAYTISGQVITFTSEPPVGIDNIEVVYNFVTSAPSSFNSVLSATSGIFSTQSQVFIQVPNLNVNLTTTGRPVRIELIHDGSGVASGIEFYNGGSVNYVDAKVQILRNGVEISRILILDINRVGAGNVQTSLVPGQVCHVDLSCPAGLNNFSIGLVNFSGTGNSATVKQCKLLVYEL